MAPTVCRVYRVLCIKYEYIMQLPTIHPRSMHTNKKIWCCFGHLLFFRYKSSFQPLNWIRTFIESIILYGCFAYTYKHFSFKTQVTLCQTKVMYQTYFLKETVMNMNNFCRMMIAQAWLRRN